MNGHDLSSFPALPCAVSLRQPSVLYHASEYIDHLACHENRIADDSGIETVFEISIWTCSRTNGLSGGWMDNDLHPWTDRGIVVRFHTSQCRLDVQ
jgi:hypothetical protein